jgi:phosphoserine phosphatase
MRTKTSARALARALGPGQVTTADHRRRETVHSFEPNCCQPTAGAASVDAVRPLKRVAAVVFDCDSTLSAIEGVDELALEQRAAVAALTDAAMTGAVPLEAVYGKRLALIRPDRARVDALARLYVERLVPDAAAVVCALHGEAIDVRIISGGLAPAVQAVAAVLGVPRDRVAAVDVQFADDGTYAGYDVESPLARAGGKADVLAGWRREVAPLMLVGDGATDLEASGVADVFVAYAGVVERDAVVGAADVVIRSASLAPVLPLALGGAPPRAAEALPLYRKGVALLEDVYRSSLFPSTL